MLIGIISDTHNRHEKIFQVAEYLRNKSITTLLHCGDVTSSSLIQYLDGFDVRLVFGNNDYAPGDIEDALKKMNPKNSAGNTLEFKLEGKRFYMAHGDNRVMVERAVLSNAYDFIISGHTHRFKDQVIGKTRVLNPGALGGIGYEPRSFAILDVQTGTVLKVVLED